MAVEAPSKKRNIRRRLIGGAFSLITLAVLTYIALQMLSGSSITDVSWLRRVFSSFYDVSYAEEFDFTNGKNRVFADLDGAFASVGTLGVQVLDYGGGEMLRDAFQASGPAIEAANGRAVAFDVGGTELRVFDAHEVLVSLETKGAIWSASINKNGWFCVCTQEGGGFKGKVTVYNNKGKDVYSFGSAQSGYILDAVLSGDNRNLAVLSLTDTGSRITLFSLNSKERQAYFDLDGGVIIDVRYLPDGRVLAFEKESVILVDKNGGGETLYEFSGKSLRKYAEDGGLIALYLLDYGIGNKGRLVTLNLKGEIQGELELDREITALSVNNKKVALLRLDGLTLYSGSLDDGVSAERTDSGANAVIALESGAFAAGEYTARVVTVAENTE